MRTKPSIQLSYSDDVESVRGGGVTSVTREIDCVCVCVCWVGVGVQTVPSSVPMGPEIRYN